MFGLLDAILIAVAPPIELPMMITFCNSSFLMNSFVTFAKYVAEIVSFGLSDIP